MVRLALMSGSSRQQDSGAVGFGLRRLGRQVRKLAGELWSLPGPGVVTGASDDDPSGIATYSLTGAQTGYRLLWTSILTLPLNAAVQNMCARIGLVTGEGLASALRRHYSRRLLLTLVVLLFVANTVNIGADIAAVAAGIDLLTGLPACLPAGAGHRGSGRRRDRCHRGVGALPDLRELPQGADGGAVRVYR